MLNIDLNHRKSFLETIGDLKPDPILNEKQREAVLYTEGPLLVLAGAGTGKTRVITYRIAYLLYSGISPQNILGVTFTNKAAQEMKKRVIELCPEYGYYVWISTFHSFASKILRREASRIGLNSEFVIYDETDQKNLIKQCLQDLNLDEKKYKVDLFYDAISRAKDNLIDADSYMIYSLSANDPIRYVVANVYKLYQKKLNQNIALDFGDLLLKLNESFYTYPELREKYQNIFKYVMVDEYQDTNHAQHILIKYLVLKHKNICVVGDDDQSIYSWRGARVQNILDFEKEFPGTKIIKLEQNYRSTKNILECAWNIIKNNHYRKEKKLWCENSDGEEIIIHPCENEIEEAEYVAKTIKYLHKNKKINYNDIAIFYRTNAQSRVFEDIFIRDEIPYNLVGTVRFYERKEIKDIISYLRIICNPEDSISLKRIINVPRRNIGTKTLQLLDDYSKDTNSSLWNVLLSISELDKTKQNIKIDLGDKTTNSIKKFVELINELRKLNNKSKNLTDFTKEVLEKTQYLEMLKKENTYESKERIRNLEEFVSVVNEYETSIKKTNKSDFSETSMNLIEKTDLISFINSISLISNIDTWENEMPRVTLMTLHLAKGLEFKYVFITGMEEGLFPLFQTIMSDNKEELEEERRLCYVGITRAKQNVFLTYSNTRKIYGQIKNNIPSRFIREASAFRQDIKTNITEIFGEDFKTGGIVLHKNFGIGKILKITGEGDNKKVVVKFTNGQWKKLILKYANLTKIT